MGAFDGIRDAKIFERGTPLTPITNADGTFSDGHYALEIVKCQVKATQAKGPAFIAEFKVLTSDNPAHKVGDVVSFYQSMVDLNKAYPSIKAFLLPATGVSVRDKVAVAEAEKTIVADMEDAVREVPEAGKPAVNALAGVKVSCIAHNVFTVEKPGKPSHPFTQYNFEPLAG
jgi:hypothetical protein